MNPTVSMTSWSLNRAITQPAPGRATPKSKLRKEKALMILPKTNGSFLAPSVLAWFVVNRDTWLKGASGCEEVVAVAASVVWLWRCHL